LKYKGLRSVELVGNLDLKKVFLLIMSLLKPMGYIGLRGHL